TNRGIFIVKYQVSPHRLNPKKRCFPASVSCADLAKKDLHEPPRIP
ncbi:MAG: hypothetical protein ACI9NC_002791, partial [Verrucomicrobiales bacterium]